MAAFFPRMLVAFLAILGTSLVHGWLHSVLEDTTALLVSNTLAVLLDAGFIWWLWRHRPVFQEYSPNRFRVWCWLLAWPVLLALLAINVHYHGILRDWAGTDLVEVQEFESWQLAWLLALYTLFPAVMEELFFRRLVLDSFRGEGGGVGSAIWISSIMFAMAHIGQPFGLPYLLVFGVFMALLRVGSGTLALPMLVHGLHNAVIFWIEFFGNPA